MRRTVVVLSAVVVAAVAPGNADAHANLVRTDPSNGAVLTSPPAAVRIVFDDAVRPAGGSEAIRNGDASVLRGRARLAHGNGRVLVIPLRARLPDGDYSVRWRIISDDGHLEEGVLAFAVGAGRASPISVLSAASTRPSAADVFARWLWLGGILLAGGGALYGLLIARPRGAPPAPGLVTVGLLASFFGAFGLLARTHAGATRFGLVMDVAVVVAAVGATLGAVARVYPRLVLAASAAALALLAAPSLAGHALDPGRTRAVAFALDLLHVLAAAFWIGGLAQLLLALRTGAGGAAWRFSRLALPTVLVLAAAGVGRALGELSSVSQLWTTGYGRTILVKTALFAVTLALAAGSRGSLDSIRRLRTSVGGELAVLVVLVAAVGLLTGLRPGRDTTAVASPEVAIPKQPLPPPRGAIVLAGEDGPRAIAVAVAPHRVTVTVLDPSGGGADGLDVEVDGTRAASCGPGCYRAPVQSVTSLRVGLDGRQHVFPLPARRQPAGGIVARATRVFRHARSVVYDERLTNGVGAVVETRWTLVRPNRIAYRIRGGAQAIVIGARRWDRDAATARWVPSETQALPQPQPTWGGDRVTNAYVLGSTPRVWRVSFADPSIPAWFESTIDRRTGRTLSLRMTAAAHFMRHRYLGYDRPIRIVPPR